MHKNKTTHTSPYHNGLARSEHVKHLHQAHLKKQLTQFLSHYDSQGRGRMINQSPLNHLEMAQALAHVLFTPSQWISSHENHITAFVIGKYLSSVLEFGSGEFWKRHPFFNTSSASIEQVIYNLGLKLTPKKEPLFEAFLKGTVLMNNRPLSGFIAQLWVEKAIVEKDSERLEWLLSNGISGDLKDCEGLRDVMSVAFDTKEPKMIELLLKYNADPTHWTYSPQKMSWVDVMMSSHHHIYHQLVMGAGFHKKDQQSKHPKDILLISESNKLSFEEVSMDQMKQLEDLEQHAETRIESGWQALSKNKNKPIIAALTEKWLLERELESSKQSSLQIRSAKRKRL